MNRRARKSNQPQATQGAIGPASTREIKYETSVRDTSIFCGTKHIISLESTPTSFVHLLLGDGNIEGAHEALGSIHAAPPSCISKVAVAQGQPTVLIFLLSRFVVDTVLQIARRLIFSPKHLDIQMRKHTFKNLFGYPTMVPKEVVLFGMDTALNRSRIANSKTMDLSFVYLTFNC